MRYKLTRTNKLGETKSFEFNRTILVNLAWESAIDKTYSDYDGTTMWIRDKADDEIIGYTESSDEESKFDKDRGQVWLIFDLFDPLARKAQAKTTTEIRDNKGNLLLKFTFPEHIKVNESEYLEEGGLCDMVWRNDQLNLQSYMREYNIDYDQAIDKYFEEMDKYYEERERKYEEKVNKYGEDDPRTLIDEDEDENE